RLADSELAKWQEKFAASEFHREFVAKRLRARPTPPAENVVPQPQGTLVLGPSGPQPVAPSSTRRLFADRIRDLRRRAGRLREWLHPAEEQLHQFTVLTTRYAELVWSDHRTMRLVFLQAPIVALFLLAGFLGKRYEERVPAPRRLTAAEHAAVAEAA